MKNKLFIIGALFMLLLQGCEKFLTVDIPDSLIKENYWKSKDHAEAELTGVYTQLGLCIPRFIEWGGIRSEIYSQSGGAYSQFIDQDIRIYNNALNWNNIYKGINYTNSFIKNAHRVLESDRSFTQKDLDMMMGQAYGIRALYYFYLVRAFENVPYWTEPYESDTQLPHAPALPENVVLDSIESDLAKALELAPESFVVPTHNYGYVTQNAVRAIWADVKLWRKKYDECIELCNQLAPKYETTLNEWDTWFSQFSVGNSKESIFEYQYLEDGPSSTNGSLFYSTLMANYTGYYYNIRKVYPQDGNEPTTDTVRFKRTVRYRDDYQRVFKFSGVSAENNIYVFRDLSSAEKVNFIFYRYREVMFMKAEALAMLSRYGEAIEIVNTIREATGLELTTSETMGSGESFLDKLICENRAELGFEGKDWFTLLRIARNSEYHDLLVDRIAQNSASGVREQILTSRLSETRSWFLPYLQTEVENNLLLEQKEFYEGKK